jgi:hypothetical protein
MTHLLSHDFCRSEAQTQLMKIMKCLQLMIEKMTQAHVDPQIAGLINFVEGLKRLTIEMSTEMCF